MWVNDDSALSLSASSPPSLSAPLPISLPLPQETSQPAAAPQSVVTPQTVGLDAGGHAVYKGQDGILIYACGACHQYPKEGEVMLVCDGCEREFHPGCVGLDSNALASLGDWFCSKCEQI